ncbi:VTC domain-containing protein, partial [Bacteroidota bacterium]
SMSVQEGKKSGNRFERKFVISRFSRQEAELIIKTHPEVFSEIFHERIVNNIYLDTPNLTFFFENISGKSQRKKVRIRWYGDLFGDINKPVLEYKIKEGAVGKKISFLLEPFKLDENFDLNSLMNVFSKSLLPSWVINDITGLEPKLLNRYTRKYFRSFDRIFRTTIDYQLVYHDIQKRNNSFLKKVTNEEDIIIELKYDFDNDKMASIISSSFPFRITRSSKYVNGISSFHINQAL